MTPLWFISSYHMMSLNGEPEIDTQQGPIVYYFHHTDTIALITSRTQIVSIVKE